MRTLFNDLRQYIFKTLEPLQVNGYFFVLRLLIHFALRFGLPLPLIPTRIFIPKYQRFIEIFNLTKIDVVVDICWHRIHTFRIPPVLA